VSDLTRKSGVGRATFYAHYESKDALLRTQMDRFVVPLVRLAPGASCEIDATALFAHTRAAPSLYRALMAGRGRRVVEESVEAHVARLCAGHAWTPSSDVRPDLVARFVAASLLGLVSWWVERPESMTPEEMQATFRALCGRGRTG
jgi:AcrR family transcriptional regulator